MKIKLLGDPHLARQFIHGVPLHRRGHRETMVWNDFADSVQKTKQFDIHVCMGDLFDKAVVSYHAIRRAAEVYLHAAENSKCQFVILKGNHDWMRDLTLPSAFDIFAKIVDKAPNIHIVDTLKRIDNMLFAPWHPTASFKDQVHAYENYLDGVDTVYSHWDLDSYGGSDINLIDYETLRSLGVTHVYNGHIHRPHSFSRGGVDVEVVGSMQPYAHGEEIDESLYVTRDFNYLGDLSQYRNKCLRVRCKPKEFFDDSPDVLQLVIKRESEAVTELDVDLDSFDIESMFVNALKENKVSDQTREKLLDHFQKQRLGSGA